MFSKIYGSFENILFLSQCGMQKGHSTQKILVMIEAFKEGIGRGNIIAII